VTLGDRTRYQCTQCDEFIEIDLSPEDFEQAANTKPQPTWLAVAQDTIGGFLQAHGNGCPHAAEIRAGRREQAKG
jgi:hypothetical protein